MKIDRLIFNDCIISGIDAEMSINGNGVFVENFEFDNMDEVSVFLAKKNYTKAEAIRRITKEIEKYCNQFCDEHRTRFIDDAVIKYPAMLAFKMLQFVHFTDIHLNSDF